MADMLSPGIYLQESDYSEYVTSSSTCIVGCVGEAKRGPIGVPTLVTSQKALTDLFGTPTEGEYGIHAALQILTQASQLYYVRVVRSATQGTAGKIGEDAVIYKSLDTGTEVNGIKIRQTKNENGTFKVEVLGTTNRTYTEVTPVAGDNPSQEGWFVKVDDAYTASDSTIVESGVTYYKVEYQVKDISDVTDVTGLYVKEGDNYVVIEPYINPDTGLVEPVAPTVDVTYYEKVYVEVTNVTLASNPSEEGWYELEGDGYELSTDTTPQSGDVYYEMSETTEVAETFDNLSLVSTDANFVEKVLKNSNFISAEVYTEGTLAEGEKIFTIEGAVNTGAYASTDTSKKLIFRSKYYDSTLNRGKVLISEPDAFGYFNITVSDADDNTVEMWNSVTLNLDDERYIGSIINKGSKRISVEVNEADIDFSGDELIFSGGDDGVEGITDEDFIGEADGTGVHALDNPELLSIDVMVVPGKTSPAIIEAALNVCKDRGDSMLVADVPFGLSASEAVNWTNGDGAFTDHAAFDSSYGAFYWPWIRVSDNYSKKNVWMPPSGYIVAKYAYNDKVAYPWVAPAGVVRGRIQNVLGIEHSPTKGERDLLYGNRNIVNPIANFQNEGLVIWGQKTMQRKPTALDRVNVRRLVGYLKRVIGNATRSFVFEQNNASTWTEWKSVVNPLLNNVKASGGLYEYMISINPTAEDIENNRMPVYVYVKPTKTAEFIPIIFNIAPYSASFTDATE